jgi:hypothetical protein
MRRRELIILLGASAVAWPLPLSAQQGERMRRIGVLLPAAADDADFQARVGAFLQALALLDWTIGRNVRIDTPWATTNAAEIRRHGGTGRARIRRHSRPWFLDRGGVATGDRHRADRIPVRPRSGRCGFHRRLAVNSAVGSASRRGRNIRRREFIGALGGAAAWPLAARAQQPTVPVIGWMSGRSPEDSAHLLAAVREGLRETGFVESESDEMRNSP